MDFTIHLKLFSFTRKFTISKSWFQFLVISLVLLASLAVSFWGASRIFILVIGLLFGFAGLIILMQRPNLGFIFIFLGGMFVRYTGPSGLNAATVMVGLMIALWLMDMFVVKRRFTFIRSETMLPLVLFLAISVLSFGMGQIPWFVFARQAPLTAQMGGFAIFVLSIGGTLLTAHLIRDIRWLQIIVWTFIGLSTVYLIGRAAQLNIIDRIFARGFTAESMFWTWLIALSASQVIYNDGLKLRIKVLLIGIVVLTMYVAIVQAYDWKSGWFPPLVVLAALIGNRYRKLVVFIIPFVAMASVYVALKLIASDDYSWGTRLDAWKIVLEISRVSPILGMGFANYYWYTPLFPIRGWRVSFNSHSQFVDLIAQTGYLGLLCFLWIFFTLGTFSWKLANRLPDGFARAYSYGVCAGIIGSMVAAFLVDWVLPFVYNIGLTGFRASILPWLFMGGVIALAQIQLHNPKS